MFCGNPSYVCKLLILKPIEKSGIFDIPALETDNLPITLEVQ